jgi:pentatricopeptide repeat protein
MLDHNITPSSVTYNSLIDGQIRIKNLKNAWEIYEEMKLKGLKCDNFTYSSLVKGISSEDDKY